VAQLARRAPTPLAAAALSFAFPGLGQLAAGRPRRAALFLVPALAVVALLILAAGVVAAGAGAGILGVLVRREVLVALVMLALLLLVAHVAAIIDSWQLARSQRPRGAVRSSAAALFTALVVTAALVHGTVAAVTIQVYDTLEAVFSDDGGSVIPPAPGTPSPAPTPAPGPTATPGPDPTPLPSPTPTPPPAWAEDGRLNLLLLGSDEGPNRWLLRTDTMIVLSVDIDSGRAAMFGIPRNLVNVPMPEETAGLFRGGRFPEMLSGLYVYAWERPDQFPGGDLRGYRAVAGAVQELVGVPLDGVVSVNLNGFVQLIDGLGGLWMDVPERVVDDRYPLETGGRHIRIDIREGCQLLDGRHALAYARSRHQDSDYGRMRRQQDVLVALRRQVDPVALAPRVPDLLSIARDNLWMSLARDDVGPMARLAERVDAGSIVRVTFVPPAYPAHLDGRAIERIRTVVAEVFDEPPDEPEATATPSPASPGSATPTPSGSCP
jgi:polyisoprenyl-teichoic acid--peptidoglycan teichoic acid transferase